MKRATFEALRAALAAKQPAVLVTRLDSGDQQLVLPFADDPGTDDAELLAAARTAAIRDQSRMLDDQRFLHVHNPPLRMAIVGAVHIAQSLVPMAEMAGFDVAVIDPRTAWASAARFPGVALIRAWPDVALRDLAIDRRTAVVTLTHDPKLDEPALEVALASPAFYIGALGSKRTQAARAERLIDRGFGAADLSRIHGPVGLNIGARSAAEIAISIIAQVVDALRRPEPS